MQRLNPKELDRLPSEVIIPSYDRAGTGIGIVHLGIGAFHRAHQAWYTEQVLCKHGGNWAIAGASLRSAAVREQLEPQDGLYCVATRENASVDIQVVGAVRRVLVAPEDPQALIELMAEHTVKVITLTITEKGYCHSPATGELNLEHPDIRRDIEKFGDAPVTAIGLIVASLARRKAESAGGVTVLSCDNLPHNGRLLRRVVSEFAQATDVELAQWIEVNAAFPSSMVDRIVPAATEADFDALQHRLGFIDRAAVFTEPFSQWVIERQFAGPVPDWQGVGALVVDDVGPFEDLKLRLLNGSHSIIAYLGYVAGYDFVHEAIADTDFERLVRRFMDDQVTPTLALPTSFDLQGYKESLIGRFGNRALNHKTRQIAQDGSQKIPQRWLRVASALLEQNKAVDILALAVAGWIRYLEGHRDSGEAYVIDDPLARDLSASLARAGSDPSAIVGRIMSVESVFGDLADRQPGFVQQVEFEYRRIRAQGVKSRVAAVGAP